jgi:Arylsulfotransferase (ASST)
VTRRRFLGLAGAALATIVAPTARAAPRRMDDSSDTLRYQSRPDLVPPTVAVTTSSPGTAPGYVFLAPSTGPSQFGPLIVDSTGEPVWFHPITAKVAHNFRVQRYAGEPVLTWWEGTYANGYGQGEYVIADGSYEVLARITPTNGYAGDLHEFVITSRGTALLSVYNDVGADLSAYGGPTDGTLLESIVQELDIRTGAALLEWHSSDHVPVEESYLQSPGGLWDYFHLNSIGVMPDGNLVISARHTSTVYKLDRSSGEIIWRLGGKKSDFTLGPGATFAFQHDARGHPDDLVSIFDDGGYSAGSAIEPTSRAIVLALDTGAMTAELVRAEPNPQGALSFAMGNTQLLADGGMFVGWGTTPSCSEFAATGDLLFDAELPGGGLSYRAFREPWIGRPSAPPALAVSRNGDGSLDAFASWNGATEVAHWQILGGPDRKALQPLRTVRRTGFETTIRIAQEPVYVAAVALDAANRNLGASHVISV